MRPLDVTSRGPIETRLALLYEQWETFATDSDARVLRWVIRDDERRMLEAFLAVEDDEDGELAVLFFVLDTPFERGRYGHDLRRDLDRQLAAMEEDFASLGLPPWSGATSEGTVSDIGVLMQNCGELARYVGDAVEAVALVLWPKEVSDSTQFVEWLRRAARVVPARIRLVVIDRVEAPLLGGLDGEHVRSVVADLDMQAAIEELAAAAPGRESPGGRFREAFVSMSTALSRGDLDRARSQADAAVAVAREAGFDHLEAAVPFALGGGLFGGGDIVGAIEQFRAAERRAAQAPSSDWGPTLRVKAQLGLAGVLFGAEAWIRAAHEYENAAALAGEMQDRETQVDALRMATWSCERGGDLEHAWATGLTGLGIAEEMTEEALERSTVPWLGELLLRLCANGARFEAERGTMARRLDRLLGGGWRR